MKVIFHYSAGPGLARRLAALERDGLSVSVCAMSDHERFGRLMADAEALWHLLEPVTAEVIAAAPRLRLVQKIGVGVNTIDLAAARRRGIAVCNMPGTNTQAVVEMTLLLMLGALRRVSQLDAATRAGRGWGLPPALQDHYGEVNGRTIGLVGYGAVPRRLAPVLQAMGARICSPAAPRSRTRWGSAARSTRCSPRATWSRSTCRSPRTPSGSSTRTPSPA